MLQFFKVSSLFGIEVHSTKSFVELAKTFAKIQIEKRFFSGNFFIKSSQVFIVTQILSEGLNEFGATDYTTF